MSKVKEFKKVSLRFREALSRAIKKSSYSREEMVSLIHGLTGIRISKHYFDQMTAPSKTDRRFPAELLPALCHITGDVEPLRILAEAIELEVIGKEESRQLRLFRLMKEKERIEREIESLKRELE